MPCMTRCVWIPVAVWISASPVGGTQHTFVLREHLRQTWTRERVTFAFTAGEGQCRRDSMRLVGPDGPTAFQLVGAELWGSDRTFVKAAGIALVTDLGPLQTRRFVLHYGPKALPGVAGRMPTTDLRVRTRDGTVEIVTKRFGVRLRVGEKTFAPAVPPGQVPGPLVAMRLADGTWFGGSRMYGTTKVTGYHARLVATGPVFAEVRYRYTYAAGNALDLVAHVAAGDSAVLWDAHVKKDRPGEGCRMVLNRNLPPLVFPVSKEWGVKRACFRSHTVKVGTRVELPLATYTDELVTQVTPWNDWWDSTTQTVVRLKVTKRDTELQLASRDPGAWVTPAAPGTMRDWAAWQHKLLAVKRLPDGEVVLDVNLAAGAPGGVRKWSIGEGEPAVGRRLDVVKDYVLDWPRRPGLSHPHLFVSGAELRDHRRRVKPDPAVMKTADYVARETIRPVPSYKDHQALAAWLVSGDRQVAEKVKLAERLRRHLNLLGKFDLMRSTTVVAALYDGLIESVLIGAKERPFLRAQMAYLGYTLADPATWSIERGYRSYNPNMSVSYVLSLGIVACLLPDHPKAREWVKPAVNRTRRWLADDLGPNGEWTESAHYSHVTASMLVAFAVAARRAGFCDLIRDGALKKLMLYLAKQYTPRDPQRGNVRVNPPLGRANAGSHVGLAGVMAKATATTDPAYSAVMQWVWQGTGYSTRIYDGRLGGFEHVYMDRRLPATAPDWASEWFPHVGALLRHGVGTPNEHYVSLLANSYILFSRPSEVGAVLKVFSMGRPVGGAFTGGYNWRQELLMSRVMPARTLTHPDQWDQPIGYSGPSRVSAFAATPRLDYVCADFTMARPYRTRWRAPKDVPRWPPIDRPGKAPIGWRRQMMFVKDGDPAGTNYLVLRDTVTGAQPTMWQFWTLSEKIGTPDQVRDVTAFLADKPGCKVVPPRRLEGDRFCAVGQLDVDVDYYIAAPKDTPRYTLRYGGTFAYPVNGLREYQDLLHLRLPGDGHYYVAMFPRLRTTPAPTFSTHAKGTVVKVAGAFGTDYCLLNQQPTEATVDGIGLEGTSACVQRRRGEVVLALGAAGEVRYQDITVTATGAVTLRWRDKARIRVDLPPDHRGTQVRLHLPTGYKWDQSELDGKTVATGDNVLTLMVNPRMRRIHLTAQPGPFPWPPG